jgi:predicted N-formylglutamate amidohydrolase
MKPSLIITCEHAGNEVPDEYRYLFEGHENILASHRGWDPGALDIATFLAESLHCPLYSYTLTRLLIEPNRSIDSPQLFSEFSTGIPAQEKLAFIDEFYLSYRHEVESEIRTSGKPVVHISVHTFTPVLEGVKREVDIGILFDPGRWLETAFSQAWKNNLVRSLPDKTIRFNEPYKGIDDGFTTYLRTRFPDGDYAGIEIEINQRYAESDEFLSIQTALLRSLPADF